MGSCLSSPGGAEVSEIDKARHKEVEKHLREVSTAFRHYVRRHGGRADDYRFDKAKAKMAAQVKVCLFLSLVCSGFRMDAIRCCFWGLEILENRRYSRLVFQFQSRPSHVLSDSTLFGTANATNPQNTLFDA
jgi:hypothetical protein